MLILYHVNFKKAYGTILVTRVVFYLNIDFRLAVNKIRILYQIIKYFCIAISIL